MSNLALAFGLMMALEGLLYAAFPVKAKHWAQMILQLKPETIRWVGIGCAIAGTVLVWWSKQI